MKTIRFTFVLLLCALIGIGIGGFFRSGVHSAQRSNVMAERGAAASRAGEAALEDKRPFLEQLKHDLANSTGAARWFHWVEAVEKAALAEFPALVELAGGDVAALRLIGMRWVELDPEDLLGFLARNGDRHANELLSEVLFPEWAKRNPTALIEAMESAPAPGALRTWRWEAAEYVTRFHPRLGLPLFEKWSIGMYTPSMRGVAKWAGENPREAAEFALTVRAHHPATAAMKSIGEQWAKSDPLAGLTFAEGEPSSLGQTLAHSILKTWAERDLPAAAEWLGKTDERNRNRFSAPVVEEWARTDPAAALLWSEKNLTGSRLAESAAAVIRGAAEKDPNAAARLVLAMQPSAARAAGAVEAARKLLPGREGKAHAATPEALAWLRSLDAGATRLVLDEAVRYWPDVDPKGMASYLLTAPAESISSSVYLLVGRTLGRSDPIGALEWANELPEKARLAGGSDAFARWCQAQPANAMQWLGNVPANDPRHSAYLKTALEYLAYEHNVTERVAALPLPDRAAALELARTIDLSGERRERLLSALGE